MKRAAIMLAVMVGLAATAVAGERYTVQDKGGFGRTGRHVEFPSRYGWESYEVDFSFGLERHARALTRRSKLTLKVTMRDGSTWKYRCKASREDEMWANINKLYGKGISILTECRISPKKFAKAVDLDPDLVGDPTLVFHVTVKDGQASVGVQKGMYFVATGDINAGPMRNYAIMQSDPSNLGVIFASAGSPRLPGYYSTARR